MKKVFFLFFSVFLAFRAIAACPATPLKVEIKKETGKFRLYKNGEPYFIKGAVGWNFLEELSDAGANSLRTSPKLLDVAHRLGLSVLVNLPVAAERSGFDSGKKSI